MPELEATSPEQPSSATSSSDGIATPKMVKHKIGTWTGELPEGYEVHDSLKKAIAERDSYGQRLKSDLDAEKSKSSVLTTLEQALRSRGSEPEKPPDPIEDPEKHATWLENRVTARLSQKMNERERVQHETASEVNNLDSLARDYLGKDATDEQITDLKVQVFQEATRRGLLNEYDTDAEGKKSFHFKEGAARMVFRDLHFDELQKRASAKGLEQVQQTIGDAQNAPLGAPGAGLPRGQVPYEELRRKDPDAAARLRQEQAARDAVEWEKEEKRP